MPGTLQVAPDTPPPVMQVIAFNQDRLVEEPIEHVDQLQAFLDKGMITWINVDGLGDPNTIKQIGELFGFHLLALEDVINVHQRAKVEPFGDHLLRCRDPHPLGCGQSSTAMPVEQ